MELGVSLQELSYLRKVGNVLLRSKEIEEVIQESFKRIEEKLHPQVISLFLFSKDGFIERFHIQGIDQKGIPIGQDWLENEKYHPGESFSGKAAEPKIGEPYGEPNWSNSLDQEVDKLSNGKIYAEKLGFLKCGISVPLNGTQRTFGTLEVINKVDQIGNANSNLGFSEEEVYWLTIMGSFVANAISRLRKKDEEKIFAEISCRLADPENEKIQSKQVYDSIVKQLVEPLMPYKACILRMTFGSGLFVIAKDCTDDINFEGKDENWREVGQGIVGEVFRDGIYRKVEEIELEKSRFQSIEWIEKNKLKSFICYPLVLQGKVVGTISLFTGYIHKFSDSEIDFLKNVSFLLAAYRERIDLAEDIRETANKSITAENTSLEDNETDKNAANKRKFKMLPNQGSIPIDKIHEAVQKVRNKK